MNIHIPGSVTTKIAVPTISAVLFFVGYYINDNYVQAAPHKEEHQTDVNKILDAVGTIGINTELALESFERKRQIQRAQDRFDENVDEMLYLESAIEDAPQSILAKTRRTRLRALVQKDIKLSIELEDAKK